MAKHSSPREETPVSWIGGARATDDDAEIVRQAIVVRGHATYGSLLAHTAEEFFVRDHVCAGAVADIGFFRAWYRSYAHGVLERLEGTDIGIGGSGSQPPAPHP